MKRKKFCEATISFGDDYGDNLATFRCQLEPGHEGLHKEEGDMGYKYYPKYYPMPYTLTWKGSRVEYALGKEIQEERLLIRGSN